MMHLNCCIFLLITASTISTACLAFTSPRIVRSFSHGRSISHESSWKGLDLPSRQSTLFVPLYSVESDTTDNRGGKPNESGVSDKEMLDILQGGTTSLETIASEGAGDKGKKDDPFGVVRLGAVAILSVAGLLNLLHDASKFGESVEGGYVAGSIVTLAIDSAFTLAMAGALYKEWMLREEQSP